MNLNLTKLKPAFDLDKFNPIPHHNPNPNPIPHLNPNPDLNLILTRSVLYRLSIIDLLMNKYIYFNGWKKTYQ